LPESGELLALGFCAARGLTGLGQITELSSEIFQQTALLIDLASLAVNALECLLPEPHRLFCTLDTASRKHLSSEVAYHLETPTDCGSVGCDYYFARLIYHLEALCPQHICDRGRIASRQAHAHNQYKAQGQHEALIAADTAFQGL
jgi:hypothetical protein